MPLKQYLRLGIPLTGQDTLNFQLKGKDTMVLISRDFIDKRYKDRIQVEYEPKDSVFLEIYKDVVYGRPESKTRNTETMKYWKEEVKIFFAPGVPDEHSQYLMQFAHEISSEIDSLKISRVDSRDKSNFIVYYLNREHNIEYEPRITGKTGGYYIHWRNSRIYEGAVKINTEFATDDNYQLQLLTYHFIKSLGYFKSSDNLECESYLSDCRNFRRLTQIDREILKYHYSYGICKGVKLDDFEEMHAHMKEALRKDPNAKLYVLHEK